LFPRKDQDDGTAESATRTTTVKQLAPINNVFLDHRLVLALDGEPGSHQLSFWSACMLTQAIFRNMIRLTKVTIAPLMKLTKVMS
jgi:hypothetical protein